MTPDIAHGVGDFCFIINGERVFIRGTNWKPLSPLGSVADKKTRNGAALNEILNLNCNMVRIWGGGIYEDECFFDFCDKNGLLIWQDFMLACEMPPTDPDFARLVSEEAREIILRY
jgi:beta-mannosidase